MPAVGAALLARTDLLLPELVERRVARAQALEAEAVAVVADLAVREPLDQRLDLRLQLGGRLPLGAVEEQVPLDLQLAEHDVDAVEVLRERRLGLASHEHPHERQPQLVRVRQALAVDAHVRGRAAPSRSRTGRASVRASPASKAARYSGPLAALRLAKLGRLPRERQRRLEARVRRSGRSAGRCGTAAAAGPGRAAPPSRRRARRCRLPPWATTRGKRSAKSGGRSRPMRAECNIRAMPATTGVDPRRLLPSVDQALQRADFAPLVAAHGREAVLRGAARGARGLARRRRRTPPPDVSAALAGLAADVATRIAAEARPSLVRVLNATGVVVHTNLGRAPLSRRGGGTRGRDRRRLLEPGVRPRERRARRRARPTSRLACASCSASRPRSSSTTARPPCCWRSTPTRKAARCS